MRHAPPAQPAGPALRDIHVPEPSWWPPAPGWWIVAVLLLALLAALVWWARRRMQRQRKWHVLESELASLESRFERDHDSVALAAGLSQLIRRAVLLRGGKAQLSGSAWCEELQRLAPDHLDAQSVAVLDSAPYRRKADFDPGALMQACRSWLRAVVGAGQ